MNGTQLFDLLEQKMTDSEAKNQIIARLKEKYGDGANVTADDLLYWLYESIFSEMGWRKRHIEEGMDVKASEELDQIEAANQAISLLKPYAKPETLQKTGL